MNCYVARGSFAVAILVVVFANLRASFVTVDKGTEEEPGEATFFGFNHYVYFVYFLDRLLETFGSGAVLNAPVWYNSS